MIAILIVLPIIILGADVKLYSQYDSLLQDKLLIVTKNGFIYNYDLKYQQIRWISELGVSLQSDGVENGTHYIKPHKNGSFLFYDDVFYQINHDDLDILFKTCDMFHNALNYKTELIYFLDIATGNIKQLTQYDIHQLLSQPKLYEKGVLINILQNYISDLEYENSQQHNSRIQINFLLKYLRGDQTQLKLSNTTQIFKSKSGLYVHYLNKTLDLYLDDDVFEVFAYTPEEGIYSIIINQEITGGLTVHYIDQDMCELQGQCQINSTAIGIYKPSQFRQCLSQFYKVKYQNQIVPYQQETFTPKVEQCEKVEQDLNPFLMILLLILVVGYVSVAFKKKQQKPKEPQVTIVKEVQYVQVKQKEIKINKQKIIAAGSNGTKVYEGQLHGKPVAVKEINLQSLSNHIQEGVLEQAITTQMQLHSHHFVKYYFFEKHNECLYLAMEKCLLNLKDFAKFEQNPSLPEQQKLNIKQKLNNQDFLKAFLTDILSAFSLLQDKNIIHEGICPENIMFNDDYKVKLADLGLSRNENYYYQAVKKPFNTYSTLRQIGHMFYYLITKGDEIYLKKYLDEKMLVEKLKKLNITIPETVDIVVKLILDQSDFETIRRHPFFWSNQRKLAFICEFSDYVETFPLAPDALSLQERCINNQVFKENWGVRCGLILKYQIRGYDQTQAQQLIRLIRNTKNHYHQLPEDCKLLLGSTDESCFNYWNELFPNLFFTIYQHTLENKLNLLSLK